MPPKKTTKKQDADRIAELERQLQKSRQANEDLKNAAIEKERQARNSKIAKPDGQAGRRSGYRLEMAMGIESDRFLRILRLVRVYASIYLDIRMSISEQGKTKLELAKAKIASHIPVFKCYKGLWPLHEMLRQYLGTHKISFGKDKEAEENETAIPDRKAIEVYLHGLKSQRSKGCELDKEELEEGNGTEEENVDDNGDDNEEGDDEEDDPDRFLPSKKTISKNEKTVKFAQATTPVNSKSSRVNASASNKEKAAKKAPQKVVPVLSTIPKNNSAHNKSAEILGGSDDEEFESPASKQSKSKTANTVKMKKKTTQKKEKRKMNDEPENEPPPKRLRKKVHYEQEDISEGTGDDDFEPLKLTKKGNVKTPATTKTASTAGKKKETATQNKQKKTGPSTPHIKKAVPSFDPTSIKIPSVCPVPMCDDKVPQSPTPHLMELYERYHKHTELARQGKNVGNKIHLIGELCMAITSYWEDDSDATTTASSNGWPLEIDFESIPDRIVKLKAEITGVFANEFVLDDSAAWKTFVKNLKDAGCNLHEFRDISVWGKFRAVGSNAHAGYYGPMGVMIINSTLGRMFNHGSSAFDELGSTLATLTTMKTTDVSHPDFMFWINTDASSVSPSDFLDYVVQPFVATLLISQDLKVGEKEAEETRITSKKYGLKFNFNTDDGRMDDITMKNAMLGSRETGDGVIPSKFRRKPEMAPNACAGPGPSTMARRTAARRSAAAIAAQTA